MKTKTVTLVVNIVVEVPIEVDTEYFCLDNTCSDFKIRDPDGKVNNAKILKFGTTDVLDDEI